jgi:tRNA threonylcarbamoyladenosine biosynthesis protein TsaE
MEHPASGKGIALDHFDVYRLGGPEEFLELGLDEYFDRDGVCVIEWGSQIDAVLPVSTLRILIRLTSPEMPDQRVLTCLWPGREQDLAWLEGSIADADARI